MWLFSGLTGKSTPARSDCPMASRSRPSTTALRTARSFRTADLVLKVMCLKFGPAALRTLPSCTAEARLYPSGSIPMSKASISPFTKAAACASSAMARNVTLSNSGFAPHHLSLGMRVSTFSDLLKLSTLYGPESQSLFRSFQPSLYVSGSLTLSALSTLGTPEKSAVQSGYSALKVTVNSNLSAPALTLATESKPWVVAQWNFSLVPSHALIVAIASSASIGEPSPQTAFGLSLKLIVVGDFDVSSADTT